MGYVKPNIISVHDLKKAPLPNHGKKYTVVSHETIIDIVKKTLAVNNFKIIKEFYKATLNAEIAQGFYYIVSQLDDFIKDDDLGILFTWTNSYNKTVKFQCAIGAYTHINENMIVSGDVTTYSRKHIGNVLNNITDEINHQILNTHDFYSKIIKEKNTLKNTEMTFNDEFNLIGKLIMRDVATVGQTYSIKKNITSNFSFTNYSSAWAFYNNVLFELKTTHPKYWLKTILVFHKMMMVYFDINITIIHDITENQEMSKEDLDIIFNDMDINGNEYVEIDEDITNHGKIDPHEISDLQDGFNDFYL